MNPAVRTASDYWIGLGVFLAAMLAFAAWRARWVGVIIVAACAVVAYAVGGKRIDAELDPQTTSGLVGIGAVIGVLLVSQMRRRA